MNLTKEMFYSLLANSPNIIFVVDKEGVIQFINHTIPGLSADNVVGTKQHDYVKPQHQELVRNANGKVFSSGRSVSYEIEGMGPEGNLAWYSSTVGPVRHNDEIVAVATFTTDISDRRTAEKKYQTIKDALIAQQAQIILDLSVPVIKAWDGVLMLPLIGAIDAARGQQITNNLQESIATTQASVAIIDITGVPVVDTMVAGHFHKTIQAAQMLGAEVILTGVSPYNAQALVKLGVDLSMVTTKDSLKAGLKLAIERTSAGLAQH